jgi:hypothetical protein
MKALEKKFGAPPISTSDVKGDAEGEEATGLKGAAKDILEAIKDNDADALASALKLAVGFCQDDDEQADETDEE